MEILFNRNILNKYFNYLIFNIIANFLMLKNEAGKAF